MNGNNSPPKKKLINEINLFSGVAQEFPNIQLNLNVLPKYPLIDCKTRMKGVINSTKL